MSSEKVIFFVQIERKGDNIMYDNNYLSKNFVLSSDEEEGHKRPAGIFLTSMNWLWLEAEEVVEGEVSGREGLG